MAVRQIRLFGDPVLRMRSMPIEKIDESIEQLVTDLLDTTRMPGRAGVAACQIGVNLRAFSYHVGGEAGYVLNPVLAKTDGLLRPVDEGCLSVPNLWFQPERYEWARVTGINLAGEEISVEGDGLLGQALQHETDHQDGIVYVQKLTGAAKKEAMRAIRLADWLKA